MSNPRTRRRSSRRRLPQLCKIGLEAHRQQRTDQQPHLADSYVRVCKDVTTPCPTSPSYDTTKVAPTTTCGVFMRQVETRADVSATRLKVPVVRGGQHSAEGGVIESEQQRSGARRGEREPSLGTGEAQIDGHQHRRRQPEASGDVQRSRCRPWRVSVRCCVSLPSPSPTTRPRAATSTPISEITSPIQTTGSPR